MPIAQTTVTGPIFLPNGVTPVEGQVYFELSFWDKQVGEALFVTGPYQSVIDENGQFSVDLFTDTEGENSVVYRMSVSYIDPNGEFKKEYIGYFSLAGVGPFKVSDLTITSEFQSNQFNVLAAMEAYLLQVENIADTMAIVSDTIGDVSAINPSSSRRVALLEASGISGSISIDDFDTGTDAGNADAAAALVLSLNQRIVKIGSGSYDFTGAGKDIYEVMWIGEGEITGTHSIYAHKANEGSSNLIELSAINPDLHMQRMAGKRNITISIMGDSTFAPFAISGTNETDSLQQHIKDAFRRANPDKNITFLDRSVGGAKGFDISRYPNVDKSWTVFVDTTGTGTAGQDIVTLASMTGVEVGMYLDGDDVSSTSRITAINGNDVTIAQDIVTTMSGAAIRVYKGWIETVLAENPDGVVTGYGMNDGSAAGAVRDNAPSSALLEIFYKFEAGTNSPDLFFMNNIQPSLSAADAQYSSADSQAARLLISGLTNSMAEYHGVPVINTARWFSIVRDGVDPYKNHFGHFGTELNHTEFPLGLTTSIPTARSPEYIDISTFENIPADFWNPGTTGFLQFDLSDRTGNVARIKDDNGKLRFLWIESIARDQYTYLSEITTPVTGSTVKIERRLYLTHLEVYIDDVLLFSGRIMRGGGDVDPDWVHNGATITFAWKQKFMPGVPKQYIPQVFDKQLYDPLTGAGEDGNGLNHLTSFGNDSIHEPVIRAQNLRIPSKPLKFGARAYAGLMGPTGTSFDFGNWEGVTVSSTGVVVVDTPDKFLESISAIPTPGDGEWTVAAGDDPVYLPTANIDFSGEGTIIVEYKAEQTLVAGVPIALGVDTVSPNIQCLIGGTSGLPRVQMREDSGGSLVTVADHNLVGNPRFQYTKVGFSWKDNRFISTVNGNRCLEDTAGLAPLVGELVDIFFGNLGGGAKCGISYKFFTHTPTFIEPGELLEMVARGPSKGFGGVLPVIPSTVAVSKMFAGVIFFGGTGNLPDGWSVSKSGTGHYVLTHNMGHSNYSCVATNNISAEPSSIEAVKGTNSVIIKAFNASTGAAANVGVDFVFTDLS